ncbi:hypothetical protein MA13_contig00002-0110 [Edwardsiella piscicida]|nr:hypothetical protein MA13_contig00002-0110 [Edwardsiella piscicida]
MSVDTAHSDEMRPNYRCNPQIRNGNIATDGGKSPIIRLRLRPDAVSGNK